MRMLLVVAVVAALAATLPVRHAAAQDPLMCRGELATIVGTAGADTIEGTAGPDVIVALAGADTINGRGGDDVICAGGGRDQVNGGAGRDAILGGRGADTINGGRGSDYIDGGQGRDTINGGTGRDQLFGGRGADTINGGRGADLIWGEAGRDTLNGRRGADLLDGGNGNDNCVTAGSDTQHDCADGEPTDCSQYNNRHPLETPTECGGASDLFEICQLYTAIPSPQAPPECRGYVWGWNCENYADLPRGLRPGECALPDAGA